MTEQNSVSWQDWLAEQREKGHMEITNVPLSNMARWSKKIVNYLGRMIEVICRDDEEFFWIEGIHAHTVNENEEVFFWDQPLIRKLSGEGYVGLARDSENQNFVISTKREPGYHASKKHTVLAPPMQMSASNLKQAHGRKKPPRWEWIEQSTFFPIPQDGGCFLEKINFVGYLELDFDKIELLPNERIFTREELKEAMYAGECNDHLLQTSGLIFV